jgi:hypothetical protein
MNTKEETIAKLKSKYQEFSNLDSSNSDFEIERLFNQIYQLTLDLPDVTVSNNLVYTKDTEFSFVKSSYKEKDKSKPKKQEYIKYLNRLKEQVRCEIWEYLQ